MNGLRKPRQRRPLTNPVVVAMNHAAKLTNSEVHAVLIPVRAGFKALREGVATEDQWTHVVSAMNIAHSIELQGVVRGVRAHIEAAQLALDEIRRRAMVGGSWRATPLYYQELDNVDAAVDVFAFQLAQLSYGEYRRAIERSIAEVKSTGGTVVLLNQVGEQLAFEGA